MAPLFSKVDLNKLWHDVQNEETLICAKFGKDLFNISKVIGRKKWPSFFWLTVYMPLWSETVWYKCTIFYSVTYFSCWLMHLLVVYLVSRMKKLVRENHSFCLEKSRESQGKLILQSSRSKQWHMWDRRTEKQKIITIAWSPPVCGIGGLIYRLFCVDNVTDVVNWLLLCC